MLEFMFIDWLWIISFMLVMIGCGVIFYRLGKRSKSDFFLAGRGLPWWLPASSVYATHTATDTPMWVTGVIYEHGFRGIWYTFFSAWCAISAFVSTRIFRRSLAYTQAEWQSLRFSGLGSELLRGWLAGWQVFMNAFVLGWVGMAMGKVCNFAFEWPIWVGLVVFSVICAVYVLAAGYWGVVMADFQQGIIAFAAIVIASIWAMWASGGPQNIIDKLEKIPIQSIDAVYRQDLNEGKISAALGKDLRKYWFGVDMEKHGDDLDRGDITDGLRQALQGKGCRLSEGATVTVKDSGTSWLIHENGQNPQEYRVEKKTVLEKPKLHFYRDLFSDKASVTVVERDRKWTVRDGDREYLIAGENGGLELYENGIWRIDPFAFTGWTTGDFPIAWFITMLMIAVIGGFGMGTSIDWYPESQRIQSAKTVEDASYCIWWGSLLVVVRNSIWAAAILGFFALYPSIENKEEYEMGWYTLSFVILPHGLLGFFCIAILAIHLSTISTHLNLGAMYLTHDIYQHYINPEASDQRLIWMGRIATLILLLASFVFGSIMESITEWLIFALWIMAAGVWLPNILQVVWWRFNAWGYLSAWIFNLVVSWIIIWILPELGIMPELPEHMNFWLLMVLSAVIYLPITFLTKPENMDHLVKYYVMSRPLGFWGPVRKEAIRRGLLKA